MNLTSDIKKVKLNNLLFTPKSANKREPISLNKENSRETSKDKPQKSFSSPLKDFYKNRISPTRSHQSIQHIPTVSLEKVRERLGVSPTFPGLRYTRRKNPSSIIIRNFNSQSSLKESSFKELPKKKTTTPTVSQKIALNLQRAIDKYTRRKVSKFKTSMTMADSEKRRLALSPVCKSTSSLTLALSMKS